MAGSGVGDIDDVVIAAFCVSVAHCQTPDHGIIASLYIDLPADRVLCPEHSAPQQVAQHAVLFPVLHGRIGIEFSILQCQIPEIGKIAACPSDMDHKGIGFRLHMDVLYIDDRRIACESAGILCQDLIQFFQGEGIALPIGVDLYCIDTDLLIGLDHLQLDPFNDVDQDNDGGHSDDDAQDGQERADLVPADLFKRKNHSSPHSRAPFLCHK